MSNTKKEACKHGHNFDKSNTYINKKGGKQCKTCDAIRKKEHYLRKYPDRIRRPGTLVHGTHNGYANYHCRCSECQEARRKWNKEHRTPEQVQRGKKLSLAYYHANKERIVIERKKQYHEGGGNIKYRNYMLRKKYNLSSEEYATLLAKQNGGCAICMSVVSGLNDSRSLPVDHNHKTGKIRGILCHPCNRALGLLKEDEKIILALLRYKQKEGI